MSKPKMLSPSDFSNLLPTLMGRLTEDLRREQEDCALPDLKKDPLWDTPEVDSKTVAKLSPAVQELTGESLDPRWIRRGGYRTVEEAVAHIIDQIKLHRVAVSAEPVSVPAPKVADPVH
ncbi:hypothetical protein [Burkholderia cepacia]|uniref:hypothetical protein n=1 Tax=Burkholderia cepacia TaxID=292 RepID=UPI000757AE89|nr:hypothetical protein [Burkholderia cepacia]KVW81583.1 hypothetical protein WL00_29230 [Burkholderia cepacia]KVX74461.1 hypothetical protein WL07_09765 [Burkholderia cepacia]KWC84163.1 hypothetical protein WL58_16730 [Burkholderia cepacia]